MSLILLLFFICLGIQIIFILVLGRKVITHRDSQESTKAPSVSVIIAARNEADNLPQLIKKLSQQDHEDFEVIIANDRSIDATKEILQKAEKTFGFLQVIHINLLTNEWTGKKNALYQSVKKAKNEVLLFIDADCLPLSNQWITEMASTFQEETDVVLGYSPYRKEKGFLNLFIQFETLWVALQYLGFGLLGRTYMGVGRNMAVRKVAYDLNFLVKIKSLEGGDDDLMVSHIAKQNNVNVALKKEAFTTSKAKSTVTSYFNQKIRHLSAGKYYHKKDQTLLGIFTLSCVVGWSIFLLLLILGYNSNLVLIAFILRSLINYVILKQLGRKLNTDIDFWTLPFLDLCYCFYYSLVAIKALATKQVEWK